jgi:rhodanese-related sulfurtransferase
VRPRQPPRSPGSLARGFATLVVFTGFTGILAVAAVGCSKRAESPPASSVGAPGSASGSTGPAAGRGSSSEDEGDSAVPAISGGEARALAGKGALILDVRTAEEFGRGHVEGARNIPVDRVAGELSELPRDRPIVVYCAAGRRALIATRTLRKAGFDARNLGAMSAWDK